MLLIALLLASLSDCANDASIVVKDRKRIEKHVSKPWKMKVVSEDEDVRFVEWDLPLQLYSDDLDSDDLVLDLDSKMRLESSDFDDDIVQADDSDIKEVMTSFRRFCQTVIGNLSIEIFPLAKFKIQGRIESGKFGTVHKAELDKHPVALKLFNDTQWIWSARAIERVRREVLIHAHVTKAQKSQNRCLFPAFIGVIVADDARSVLGVAMQLLKYPDLKTIFNTRKKHHLASQNHTRQLVEAMAFLHSCNVVFWDLKPENIILDLIDDRLKVVDFGAARVGSNFDGMGTLHYTSPECFMSDLRSHGPEVDAWSLGIVLYEMHCQGRHPFASAEAKHVKFLEQISHKFLEIQKGFVSKVEVIGDPLLERLDGLDIKAVQNQLGYAYYGYQLRNARLSFAGCTQDANLRQLIRGFLQVNPKERLLPANALMTNRYIADSAK